MSGVIFREFSRRAQEQIFLCLYAMIERDNFWCEGLQTIAHLLWVVIDMLKINQNCFVLFYRHFLFWEEMPEDVFSHVFKILKWHVETIVCVFQEMFVTFKEVRNQTCQKFDGWNRGDFCYYQWFLCMFDDVQYYIHFFSIWVMLMY